MIASFHTVFVVETRGLPSAAIKEFLCPASFVAEDGSPRVPYGPSFKCGITRCTSVGRNVSVTQFASVSFSGA